MKRAVIVLLLLIANAIVGTELRSPSDPSPRRVEYSLGPFGSVDGAAVVPGPQSECPQTPRLALSVQPPAPACRADGAFEVRLFDDKRL
jgi:hypothetical protein